MNFLFLMTDQHRVDTLGAYGNPHVSTPNLDRLAATGTRFDRWYTPTAICTPARASLLTGQAPFRHKVLANQERNVGYQEDLPDDAFTFGVALRERGYHVGLLGKWHASSAKTPADYGFDGPHLPGWHNPVDHQDYLDYLKEHDLPPYEIHDRIRGTLPNGGRGICSRRGFDSRWKPRSSTTWRRARSTSCSDTPGKIGLFTLPPTFSGRIFPTSFRTSTST